MLKIINLSIIFLILILSSCSDKNTEPSEHKINARNRLKIYGFSNCVYEQLKDAYSSTDTAFSDLLITGTAYHYMGTGMHIIKQNEDTFEVLYDPYKETDHYLSKVYPSIKGISNKAGEPVVFLNCFEIYNSKEFDNFIKKQDKYIEYAYGD